MSTDRINELLRLSRAYCAQQLPWFAPGLYALRIKLSEQVPVAAVSKHWVVYWNPKSIEKIAESGNDRQTLTDLGFIWIHEVSHLLREHAVRAQDIKAPHLVWNIACDFEINDSDWPGLTMPKAFPGLLPKNYGLPEGKLAEHYLALMEQDAKMWQKIKQDLGVIVVKIPGFGQNPEEDSSGEKPWDLADIEYNEGSGVHGQPTPWEDPADSREAPSEIIQKATQRAVAKEMKEHFKGRGDTPGGWARWAEAILDYKVDWRKLLKAKIRASLTHSLGQKIDYSYRRPSRRQAVYAPVITPRLMGSTDCRIACVVDTSGSIGPKELSLMLGEIYGILQSFNCPVHIVPCDAKAYEAIKVERKSDILKIEELAGGGGTDMIAGIAGALQLKPKPDTVVVLSDGYTPYPEDDYDIQVIWGILHSEGQEPPFPPNPPWGKDKVVGIEI